jgi:hypothetical protein
VGRDNRGGVRDDAVEHGVHRDDFGDAGLVGEDYFIAAESVFIVSDKSWRQCGGSGRSLGGNVIDVGGVGGGVLCLLEARGLPNEGGASGGVADPWELSGVVGGDTDACVGVPTEQRLLLHTRQLHGAGVWVWCIVLGVWAGVDVVIFAGEEPEGGGVAAVVPEVRVAAGGGR